jgi:predicted GNAT family N-acyltransferase
MQWAASHADNVRIDTHENNYVMQNMLKKNGFVHCGTIYLEDGQPRMAFQKVCKE